MNDVPTRVAKHSYEKHNPDLNVYVDNLEDHPKLLRCHNQAFYRGKFKLNWDSTKHQGFFPVRFLCCETHRINNRPEKWILVVDPDIFCLKNIEVLETYIQQAENDNINIIAFAALSSCMLLNTESIDWSEDFLIQDMFTKHNDFDNWMYLRGHGKQINLPKIFNQSDTISPETVLLHTTKTETQPWKTGIKYQEWELHNKIYDPNAKQLTFKDHPDELVKNTVFNLFREAYENNLFSDDEIDTSIENRALRPDIKLVCNIT